MWSVARVEAAAKQPWLTSLDHLPVPRDVAPLAFVKLLDGTHSREALKSHASQTGMPLVGSANDPAIERKCQLSGSDYVERILNQLEFCALLETC
jgi:hypothetical protein